MSDLAVDFMSSLFSGIVDGAFVVLIYFIVCSILGHEFPTFREKSGGKT